MGKSSKHKAQNVHHFVSFSERISHVNIDVIHRIRRTEDEAEETFFGEALTKWTELDLTDHFLNFRREISGQVQTFEQLVHHKDQIISALKTHLTLPKSLALSALLDLLVQLARDLQQDFVPHFHDFFTILVGLLNSNSQDAETLEQTFQALAFLFRVLWRYLIKDFKDVFRYFSDLLGSSQKDYIKVFAAESCAYLLRKVKKTNELLDFLFGTLKSSPELTDGIGLLLFEMVKGVNQRFHSICEGVFPQILHKLGPWNPSGKKCKLPWKLVEQSVTILMQECAEHTTKEHCKTMWEMLLDCVSQVHTAIVEKVSSEGKTSSTPTSLLKHLGRLLRLVSLWVTHNSGGIVADAEAVAATLVTILKSPCGLEVVGSDVLQTVSDLLKSCHDSLSVGATFKINSHIFAAPFLFSDLKAFVSSLLDMPFFEKDVLPRYMSKVQSQLCQKGSKEEEEILAFITEIVIHKTSSLVTGEDLHMLKTYPLDQSWSRPTDGSLFTSYINSVIEETLKKNKPLSLSEFSSLWGAVVCLPHISITGRTEKMMALWKYLVKELRTCQKCDSVEMNTRHLVLNQLLRSILIDGGKDNIVECDEVFDILRSSPSSPAAIQILDFYLSDPRSSSVLTEERLTETYKLLEQNLVSPSHFVRLITCHILSLFPAELPVFEDDLVRENAFNIMLVTEKIKPSVQNYREKLIHLRKLEHDTAVKCLPKGPFVKAPLLFLLGNEFWNFKLLWAPLSDIIASHAIGLDTKEFWDVMLEHLKKAAKGSEEELKPTPETITADGQSPMTTVLDNYRKQFLADERKPDFTNYRIQLWKTMKKFPEKCVLASDELCSLYLTFLRNEFSNADEDARSSQCILAKDSANPSEGILVSHTQSDDTEINGDMVDAAEPGAEEEEEGEEDNDMSVTEGPFEMQTAIKRRKAAMKSLLVHLDLFALFKKQRSMFKQQDVQDTFYDFLKHRNPSIQKAAFDCIVTYKSPHIIPYRENFNRLLDDKTFKSEVVLFRVDEESSELKETDRKDLIPVLMRILYGKMHGKAGNETAGKSHSNLRRSIVFGFLSGCKAVELEYFLELLLEPCMHFVTNNPVKMVKDTETNLDLKRMIPLKKIKGVLNTINLVTQKIGHRLEGFSHSLLQILLGLCITLNTALAQRNLVLSGVVNLLKSLRHTALNRIIQFFNHFEHLDYSAEEIEATFQAVVWPQAEKLALEGVHHPTPLLKLFSNWSQSQRLLPLLGHAKDPHSGNITPLHCIFALLNAPSVNPTVAKAILELVGHLLQPEEEKDAERDFVPLPEPFVVTPELETIAAGSSLLLPHVPSLLIYLQSILSKMASGPLGKKYSSVMELNILARVSSFVTSPEECSTLCDLLVPFLSKGSNLSQDVEENTLLALSNLIQYIAKPEIFFRPISQLFSTVERRESRNLLCKLFTVISEPNSSLKTVASLIGKLNAWDKRKAEEPDYLLRLEAFSQINTMISESEDPKVDVLLPVVYNCCHFIYAVDDLSIRDNSTYCLTSIVTKLTASKSLESSKVFNVILEKTLVPQVKQGLRSKSEAVRHEFLAVLQSLVKNCPDHNMFTGLKDLCDKDLEADFFENIRHIQIHKRSRALRRLFKHLKDHQFRPEIHMSYFIPLVYAYVLDPSYTGHANLQDAAIDLLGAICKQLPWQYYLQLLKFYLKLLPKKVQVQKQIVRIIVALLDAFHFDLRNSTYQITLAPKVIEKSYKEETEGTEIEESDKKSEDKKGDNTQDSTKETLEEIQEETEILPMDFENVDDKDDVKEETTSGQAEEMSGKIVCSVSAATRIHKSIVISLLPQLHKIVTQRAKSDDEHKLVKSKYPEDEEILRVPIALAMIKLLQNLPKGTLENRLPGILLKICNFLRSRSRDIRTTARETLEKVALSLGSRFFPFIVQELKGTLLRGYQLHVLSYTTHYLLKALVKIVTPGDLDPALASVQDVFYAELFGHVSEEKEVEAIKAKFFEAKFIKAYDAYELLARSISDGCLDQLIKPIKGILESTSKQRIANKAETVLRKVADGLMANKSISIEIMMVFINSLTAKLIPDIMEGSKSHSEQTQNTKKSHERMPESCLLLSDVKPRGEQKPKTSQKTNVHVLVEFGLQLLHMCLKKSFLLPTEHLHLQLLDPLVPAIRDCLNNIHVKTCANAMRCLGWLLKFPLPSLKENIVRIAQGMFVVLQTYAGAATAKGGNQELISMCFKAVTVLLRDVAYYQITQDQLQVLLTYCEEDLYNYARQSTAFNLIRAILSRKLDVPQLHQIMDRLFEMSVTSGAANIRLQCRQVIQHYLMNYPLGKNMRKHLYFYIDHLQYEVEEGRESALEMMITIFSAFPRKILNNNCPKFFSALSMSSYNDSSAKCRKLISVALKTLIGKIDLKCRKTLFADVVKWVKSDDIRVCAMGCQVCGMFVEVEGGKFEFYLEEIFPLFQQRLDPDMYRIEENEEDPQKTEQQDICLLSVLNTFMKIVKELNIVREDKFLEKMNEIWDYVHSHLLYPHLQVRLVSCQLLGLMFSAWEPAEIAAQRSQQDENMGVTNGEEKVSYIVKDTQEKIRKFALSLCKQLTTPKLDDALATQVIKNLLFLTRVAEALGREEDLVWLAKKVMREANMEVIHNVRNTSKRNYAFKWIAAVAVSLQISSLECMLPIVMPVLQREMSEQAQDQDLKSLAQEVTDLLKKQAGVELFTTAFANSQKFRLEKRDVRKRQIAAEVVTNPDIAAKKKIRHNLKKREAKKRKFEEKKPMKRVKKNKLSILNVKVDDD